MAQGPGVLTFHHPNGDELFTLQSATLKAIRHSDAVELCFFVSGVGQIDGRLTNAELSVFLPDFDTDTLIGRRFEVPQSYDRDRKDYISCVYYFEHNDLNQNVVEVVDREGEGYRVRWSGVMGDDGDRVVIDAVFGFSTRDIVTEPGATPDPAA